jgi:hypothetical protein
MIQMAATPPLWKASFLSMGGTRPIGFNGKLFIIQATALLALPHSVGLKSVWVMGETP